MLHNMRIDLKQTGSSRGAFSLMELMIVIIILGLLAALVMPNLIGQSEKAKQGLVCTQMESIRGALDSYKLDNGRYPNDLNALISSGGGYFKNPILPKDPWKNHFIYTRDGKGINIISLGADGQEGGNDEDRDITYAECIAR